MGKQYRAAASATTRHVVFYEFFNARGAHRAMQSQQGRLTHPA